MAATSDNLWQAFKTLFGDNPTREQSQQFSTGQVADQLGTQNSFGTQAKLSDSSIQKDAAQYGSGLNTQQYQNKATIDYNQAANLKNLNQGGGSATGYSDFFNNYTPTITGSPYNPQVTTISRQNPVAVQMAYQNRLQQDNANADQQRNLVQSDRDRYNQSLLAQQQAGLQSNLQSQQINAQRDLANIQANTQKQVAATQAQGSMLSSLFGSIGLGGINHKYWN